MTCEPDHYRKAVRVSSHLLNLVRIEWKGVGLLFSLNSGFSTTLSPGRSDESCTSKDERKTPLTCPIEAN